MLDFAGIDLLAVDPVGQDGFDVARFGLNAHQGGRVAGVFHRRADLAGLDEPHPGGPVGVGEQPQEAFAVAVLAADDFLLAFVPLVRADELVQHALHVAQQRFGPGVLPGGDRTIHVPAADDVRNAVFVAVDRKLVVHRQEPALVADLGQLLFGEGDAVTAGDESAAADTVPTQSVDVEADVLGIDEVVPQFVERFGEMLLQSGQGGRGSRATGMRCGHGLGSLGRD